MHTSKIQTSIFVYCILLRTLLCLDCCQSNARYLLYLQISNIVNIEHESSSPFEGVIQGVCGRVCTAVGEFAIRVGM